MQKDAQLGFAALLAEADTTNRQRDFEKATGHLPGTLAGAVPFYRALLERHHAAMLAADTEEVFRLREEARSLALRLNGGQPGILAGPDAPGCALGRETAAPPGAVPLWGQEGDFVVNTASMRVRIVMRGMFGVYGMGFWPGFAAHAVDRDRPFISATGYRSFLGIIYADIVPDIAPNDLAASVIASYVAEALRGRLVPLRKVS